MWVESRMRQQRMRLKPPSEVAVTVGAGSAAVVVASYTSCLQAALATPGHAEAAGTYSLGQLQHSL